MGRLINGLYLYKTFENEEWTKENFAIVIGSTFTMGYSRKNIGDFARFLARRPAWSQTCSRVGRNSVNLDDHDPFFADRVMVSNPWSCFSKQRRVFQSMILFPARRLAES
jgi:hypothetical protein